MIILLTVGVVTWHSARSDRIAQQNAVLLRQALIDAGALTVPSQEQIIRVLGDDGGVTCADPDAALTKAVLLQQVATGSGGTGARPVSTGSSAVRGELLVISIYCPDQLARFQQFVDQRGLNGGD
jgi:hypothetical protein